MVAAAKARSGSPASIQASPAWAKTAARAAASGAAAARQILQPLGAALRLAQRQQRQRGAMPRALAAAGRFPAVGEGSAPSGSSAAGRGSARSPAPRRGAAARGGSAGSAAARAGGRAEQAAASAPRRRTASDAREGRHGAEPRRPRDRSVAASSSQDRATGAR